MTPNLSSTGPYEFNENENAVIGVTAGRARMWGTISIVVGCLYSTVGLFFLLRPGLLMYLAIGIAQIVIGLTFRAAGSSMTQVVATKGNDLPLMLQALQKFSKAFQIQIVMTLIGVSLVTLGVVINMLRH